MASKPVISGKMDFVADMATDAKRAKSPNTLAIHFPSFLYLELFFFVLTLKCRGLYILVLGGMTVKACHALLHLVKTELLYMG